MSLSSEQLKAEIESIGSLLATTAELVGQRHAEQPDGSWARVWLLVLSMHLRLCVECCQAVRRELGESSDGSK